MDAIEDVLAGRTIRGDNAPLEFTNHACQRYAERSGRELDPELVRKQLSQMLPTVTISAKPPSWFKPTEGGAHRAVAYALLGDDVVMPVILRAGTLLATTLITPGEERAEQKERSREWRERNRRRAGANKKAPKLRADGPRRKDWGEE